MDRCVKIFVLFIFVLLFVVVFIADAAIDAPMPEET
jgi:hypothetical protein